MSQKITPIENSQKPEFLSQDRNSLQAGNVTLQRLLVLSQGGTAKSQLQAQSQDRVSSQVNDSQESCFPSQRQVLVQSQIATQENVPSQDASSQATVPTLSQLSQTQAPIQNNATPYSSQKQSKCEKENINQLETNNASGAPSQNSQSQDLNKSCWLLKPGQSDSQGRGYLESCTQILVNAENSTKTQKNE